MARGRNRELAGPAIALGAIGVVAGATAGAAIAARRRRRTKRSSPIEAKEIARRVLEEPWKGNWHVLDEHVAEGYVGHDPSQPETIRGRDGLRASLQQYVDAFADARITVDDQVAEGDTRVASRWTARGTHSGEIAGIPPTGKEVTVTGSTISRLEGDKVAEEWVAWDSLGMLVQLGAVPAPAQAEAR